VTASQFYLSGLLYCCGVPMWPVTRRADRRYRCERCGRGVDALTAEASVWELAYTAEPRLGVAGTPYEDRAGLLADVVDRVEFRKDDTFTLVWRIPRATPARQP
jgi:hypothetical protein